MSTIEVNKIQPTVPPNNTVTPTLPGWASKLSFLFTDSPYDLISPLSWIPPWRKVIEINNQEIRPIPQIPPPNLPPIQRPILRQPIQEPRETMPDGGSFLSKASNVVEKVSNVNNIIQKSKEIIGQGLGPKRSLANIAGAFEPMLVTDELGNEIRYIVKDIKPEYKDAIRKTYEENKDLKPGYIEALLMQESHMGDMNNRGVNFYGPYGWMIGLEGETARDILSKRDVVKDERYKNIMIDTTTPENAIRTAGSLSSFKKNLYDASGNIIKTYDDPVDIYDLRWKTKAGGDTRNQFKYYYEKYKQMYE